MGFCLLENVKQLNLWKVVVSVATGAGAVYLCYKAIKTGLRCQPPFCSNSPVCIARECLVPGERALSLETSASEAFIMGRPKGDSSQFLYTFVFLFSNLMPWGSGPEIPG